MSESDIITISAESSPEGGDERRCPAFIALAIAWARPATIGGRTRHISLRCAFLLHLVAAVFSILLITILVAAFNAIGMGGLSAVRVEWIAIVDGILAEFPRHAYRLPLQISGAVVVVELGFFALALLLTPWGGQGEPIRASYKHALRQTWLHTTHVILMVLLFGGIGLMIDHQSSTWNELHAPPTFPSRPNKPSLSPEDPGYIKTKSNYEFAMDNYDLQWKLVLPAWEEWQRSRPWYVEHRESVLLHVGLALGCWFVWSLMRGVGAPRRVEPLEHPPMCEFCGYNLTTISMEGRCPECGKAVAESLGDDVRPGTPWSRRRDLGRRTAWRECFMRAMRKPAWLGRQIRVHDANPDHRWFLCLNLAFLFVLGAVGIVVAVATLAGVSELTDPVDALLGAAIFGYVITAIGLGVTLLTALVVGAYYSKVEQRNLLHGSMQVASFMAGYVILSALIGIVLGAATVSLGDGGWFEYFEELTGLHDRYIGVMFWLLPMVALGIGYLWLVARGTSALRYANK